MSRREKLSDTIQDQLRDEILKGNFLKGEYLPSEVTLCERYNVSRTTIREAVGGLVEMGYAERQQGKGVLVIDKSKSVVTDSFKTMMLRGNYTVLEFFETRRMLEIEIAELAARRASRDQIHNAEAAINKMKKSYGNMTAYTNADVLFHEALADAAQNKLISTLYLAILPMVQDMVQKVVRKSGMMENEHGYHARILDEIRERNPEQARERMLQHDIASEEMFNGTYKDDTCIREVLLNEKIISK